MEVVSAGGHLVQNLADNNAGRYVDVAFNHLNYQLILGQDKAVFQIDSIKDGLLEYRDGQSQRRVGKYELRRSRPPIRHYHLPRIRPSAFCCDR